MAELAEAQRSQHAPDTSTVKGLVIAYRASDAWLEKIGEGTRKLWSPHLDRIQTHFGPLTLKQFGRPEIVPDILRWRDQRKRTPRVADTGIQVLSRLMSYARSEGLISINPCLGLEKLYDVDRSEIIWEPDDLEKLRAVASPEIWWATQLAYLTGLRQDDCRDLRWSHIDELAIEKKTRKSRRKGSTEGKKEALIPLYGDLRDLLDSIPRRAVQVLTNTRGVPWRSGLSDSFADAAKLAGVDKHFHDLRGTAATRLYLAGFSMREIAEIMAWEEDHVEKIINRYVRRNALLRDRIRRLDENAARTETVKPGVKTGS